MPTTSQLNALTRTQQSISRSGGSLRDRIKQDINADGANVLLLDISGSMNEHCDRYNPKSPRKIDMLWQIVQDLRASDQRFRIAEFNDESQWSDSVTQPSPAGGTSLLQALEFIVNPTKPAQITIITDGQPWDGPQALRYAKSLDRRINVLYVGPSDNKMAIGFCHLLANECHGSFAANSISTEILQLEAAHQIAGFLEMPSASVAGKTINL